MPSLEIRSRPGVRWYWAPDGQQEARRFSGYRGGSPRAHVLASDPGADVPGEKTRKQDAAHAEESADLKTGTFLSVSDSLPAAFAARSISARNCNTATCDIVSARREERGSARFVLTGELSFFFFFLLSSPHSARSCFGGWLALSAGVGALSASAALGQRAMDPSR